jgi:hypothetical protein
MHDFVLKMKKRIIILASLVVCSIFLLSNLFLFAPRFDSEEIAGFKYPEGSELVFRKRNSPYKIYKWHIPEEHFSSICAPQGVSKCPFNKFEWAKREYVKFSDGADSFLKEGDIPPDSESINYRTAHHAVELIRSHSESTITIISIYNN